MANTQSTTLSSEEALQVLDSATRSAQEREEALHILAKDPIPAHIDRLIQALEDRQLGVRWEAAVALAKLGNLAVVPLLRALIYQHDSAWLREGAHHVFSACSDPDICKRTEALRQALRGSAPEVATTDAAFKVLQSLDQ